MKKILFLLLLTVASYGQTSTGQETEFDYGIKNNSTQTITTPTYLTTTGADGTQGKIPSAYIAKTAAVQDSLNKKLNLPTGFLQGLQLSINADPTKFNIAPGYYVVTDFTNLANPVVKIITYAGATGLTPAYLASANSTYVALDINGNVVSSASQFSNADRRTLAIVGNVVHSNNTIINVTNEIKAPIVASINQVHDFMRAIGFLNEEGNIYSPNGANLQINKSAGKIFGMGINSADYLNPHQLSMPAQIALTFAYRLRGGTQYANTTSIDPNNWDNAGVLTSVPVGNRWTIQRINLFQSGLTRIQYGQTVYTAYNDAVTALPTQSFVTEQNIADNAIFRCYLIVQQGTTNLASAVAAGTALFVPVDKFGNVIGNGSVALTYANIIAALGYTPENVANKQNSLAVDGTAQKFPTIDAINKAVQFVTPEQFGAVGDGVTDDSAAFQSFLNSPKTKSIPSDKIYKVETELLIPAPCVLDFNNSTLTSNTLLRLLTIKSSDVYILNGRFKSNMTGDYNVVAETEPYANSWLIGCKLITSEVFKNINIDNCYFSSEFGSINGIKLISHRSGFGGKINNVNITNNVFDKIGRMGVEILGEGTVEWYSGIKVSNNYFNDLGKWNVYGIGISLSGLSTENIISENFINQPKNIGIENAGANNTQILHNTVKNPKNDTTPMTVNSGDSGIRGIGNKSIGNTFEGTYARGVQIIFQDNYYSENNYVEKANNLALIKEVSNSFFISDTFDTTLNASVVIKDTSLNNNFDKCVFSVFDTAVFTNNISCETSSSGNYFTNSTFTNSTFGGVSLVQSGGSANNIIERYILKDNITTLAGYGITDAVTLGTMQTITGEKTFSLKQQFLDTWANSQVSLGQVGQGGLMKIIGNGGTGSIGYLGATSSALQVYSPNVLTLNSANYIDWQFNGTQKIKLFGNTGNLTIQNGGTYTDNGYRLDVNGTARIQSTVTLSTTPTTSAGTYDILTRNTSTGVVEKIASNTIATIASPTFTGTPTAPTATAGTNTTQIATTAFVQANKNKLVGYTVATLPTGTIGDMAYVTDASGFSYNTVVVGGGSGVTIVFFDGTNWRAH